MFSSLGNIEEKEFFPIRYDQTCSRDFLFREIATVRKYRNNFPPNIFVSSDASDLAHGGSFPLSIITCWKRQDLSNSRYIVCNGSIKYSCSTGGIRPRRAQNLNTSTNREWQNPSLRTRCSRGEDGKILWTFAHTRAGDPTHAREKPCTEPKPSM